MEQTESNILEVDFRKVKFELIKLNKDIIRTMLEVRIPNLSHNPVMAKNCLDIIHHLQQENKEFENDLKANRNTNDSGTIRWHQS